MRDPERIPELCALLQRAWELDPDMRLGQLVVNAIRPTNPCGEVSGAEDARVRRGLRQLLERGSPRPRLPPTQGIELEWETLVEPEPTTVTFDGARLAHFDAGEREEWFCVLLEVRFGGCYRYGSQGNPDAHAMMLELAKLLWHSRGADVVLLDLSRLSYEWGNSILGLFELIQGYDSEYPLGVVVLGGPDSTDALRSLGIVVHTDRAAAYEEAKAQAVRRSMDIG